MNDKNKNKLFRFAEREDLDFILSDGKIISFKDFFNQSKKLAAVLKSNGISSNDYVSVLIDNQIDFIKTIISLWYIGAIPVPINSKLLEEEIAYIISDYNFKYLITDKNISLQLASVKIFNLQKIEDETFSENTFSIPEIDNEAVVIFTSGSTGRPKGVVHTFATLISSIENGNEVLHQGQTSRWLASLPFYHIGGFQIICRSIYFGCSIIVTSSLQLNEISAAMIKYQPTHMSLVSTQLERLLDKNFAPPNSLKVSLIGGGFISDELMTKASGFGWNPLRVYGSSETASFVTAISSYEIPSKPESVGKPVGNNRIKISQDSEILIASDSLFIKYLDNEKETNLKLQNGIYHTGDLGFVDNDGYLFIEARRNDLIVTGGENVNPIEVESELKKITGIEDACVFPKPNKLWGQIVAAAIVCSDKSLSTIEIKEILKKRIAGFKIPKEIYYTDKLPRTALGKLEREKIRKMF